MNILASYNWIKEYVALKENAEAFARKISLSGPSVERLYPQEPLYDKMVMGKILEVKPHPNADKLRLVQTDIGTQKLEIVCGGSNLTPGMNVVVALVGAKVRWHGEGELVALQPATIRGVKSDGMICGANEIGLAAAFPHAEKEIMDMSWCKAKPGTSLTKALDLDDTVFDIEVTTNRPDAFSIIGLGREASAILGGKFLWKEVVLPSLSKHVKQLPLVVKNLAPKLCTRYQAVVMDNVTVGPSPWWLKRRLLLAGLRPINTVVDITNYVMMEYGQPLHAFDYEKLQENTIVVRTAKKEEVLTTLDEKKQTLSEGQLIIADANRPLAVAGVMGGVDSGVSDGTKVIVFEAATFDPVSVRRTARALNLHSDSSLRFEKGLPEELTQIALARAVELCQEVACGRVASQVIDLQTVGQKKIKYTFRPEKAEALIGVSIPRKTMFAILKSLGFSVTKTGAAKNAKYEITVPFWRERDIEGERDFAEEIARVYGYHNLPSVVPDGTIPLQKIQPMLGFEEKIKDFFCAAGFTELLSYSFVSQSLLEKSGIDPATTLKIANPLSLDFECMRPSLIPGALAIIKENSGLFPEGKCFEVSNVYESKKDNLPEEQMKVMAAIYGQANDDHAFRELKGLLEKHCSLHEEEKVIYKRIENSLLWHPGRSVQIFVDNVRLGTLGEIHPSVLTAFGMNDRVTMLDIDLDILLTHCNERRRYLAVSPFPPVKRDLAFVVGDRIEYQSLEQSAKDSSVLLGHIELFDVYRGENIGAGKKSIALHLEFTAERTLTAEEVDIEIKQIIKNLEEKFGAVVRT